MIFVYACKKESVSTEEKPFIDLLNQSSLLIDTTIEVNTWIYGFKFKALKSGNITSLGIKLPKEGPYPATLWDLDKNVVLAEALITSNTSHQTVFKSITPIRVLKNTTLGISIVANSFYKMRNKDLSAFAFPIQKGNINILSFNESKSQENPSNEFPSKDNATQMSPCVDIIFIAED